MRCRQNASTRSPQGRARRAFGVSADAKAASPQKWDPDGAASLPFVFDGRCRARSRVGSPLRSKRVGAPQRTQTSVAQRRLRGSCEFERAVARQRSS
jgi:hypothetical protein